MFAGGGSALIHLLIPAGLTSSNADGLFGTAVATMGMLSTAAYVLTMDVFGPISDNAGGIVEMSQQPENVRAITDLLVWSFPVTRKQIQHTYQAQTVLALLVVNRKAAAQEHQLHRKDTRHSVTL